ncbi:MAG: phosphonate metabolism protein/1,5-bisphosphokinase (PRPP-forming) PhnN [Alphaproteobacteria bacterium]
MRATPPLFYVIGPSGAGKDTLIAGVRARLRPLHRILFAHRYITRPADAGGENHVALEADDFAARAAAGLFALDWESHGNRYGIGIEIHDWLAGGFAVVVNGSRGCLATAVDRFPSLAPVMVTAPPDVLAERLARRGREPAAAIAARLARSDALNPVSHPALRVIENSDTVEDGVAALTAVLTETIMDVSRASAP